MGNQISSIPCDRKFRKWLAKEIRDMYEETDTKEDFRNRLILVADNMLKVKRSVWLRLEKEE